MNYIRMKNKKCNKMIQKIMIQIWERLQNRTKNDRMYLIIKCC